MRILICNDDGFDAAGLKLLAKSAKRLADEVYVAAPAVNYSGASRKVTFSESLKIREPEIDWADGAVVAEGTPIDALCVALMTIYRDLQFDLVLAGINRGANLGHDDFYSGNANLALEAYSMGILSLAFSQVGTQLRNPNYLEDWIVKFVQTTLKSDLGNFCLNVNFPSLKDYDSVDLRNPSNVFNGTKYTLLSGYHRSDTFREIFVDGEEGVRHFNFERLSKVADQPEDKRFQELPELLFDQEAINQGFVSVTPLTDML
ncbi:MAG: hypothetical protein K8S87_12665, partial [Planctomycetes bacterium]|nr:hypothetical protein [Planctomycetota bacterium]